jgi:hypothetical protein
MILLPNPLISEVGMSQLVSELNRDKCTIRSIKTHNNAYGEERLAYIRTIVLLAGKVKVFKFCNYGFVLAKVSQVILRLFRLILLFMRLILVVCGFCRDIRAAGVYFAVYDLFVVYASI